MHSARDAVVSLDPLEKVQLSGTCEGYVFRWAFSVLASFTMHYLPFFGNDMYAVRIPPPPFYDELEKNEITEYESALRNCRRSVSSTKGV
jgi:hypothetical protein